MSSTHNQGSRAVMTRLPLDMWQQVAAIAEAEATTIAAVVRRLARERLEQLRTQQAPGAGDS